MFTGTKTPTPRTKAKGRQPQFSRAEAYERTLDSNRSGRRKQTKAGQDIGPIPEVTDKNWNRRLKCAQDLELACKTYWPHEPYFYLPFSRDHSRVFAKSQQAVTDDGLFALAMPRGFGKTTICRASAIWAEINAFRRFCLLVSAGSAHAILSLEAIKAMLVESPALREDYPEIVVPILALEGEAKRQLGQRCLGMRTEIHWGGDHLILPKIPPQKSVRPEQLQAGGAKVYLTGITGSKVRGFNVKGERPDLLICDDPQTDVSANSVSGCEKRESILAGMAMGLAGPSKKIAGIMPCTVVREFDMADNILDHTKHPEWDSMRTKMVYAFPTRMDLWEKYRDIRNNYNPYADANDKKRAADEATEFYKANKTEMGKGAVIAWPEQFAKDEADALQSAMNLYFQDRRKFFAEKQNQPLPPDLGNVKQLTANEICEKLNHIARGVAPIEASTITAFIDMQQNVLYWMAVAWDAGFSGWILDYDTWPKQNRPYFTAADITNTLERETKIAGVEGQLREGLKRLTQYLMEREWIRQNGASMKTDQLLIDSGKWSKLVYEFVRNNPYGASVVLPSKGVYVGPTSAKDVDEGAIKPGDNQGLKWRMPAAKEDRGCKLVSMNVNFWKTFIQERLGVAAGNAGCITLFGDEAKEHRMLADHLTAEYATEVKSKQRACVVWEEKPGKPDNHWLDCLVGASVAASIKGVSLEGIYRPAKPKVRKRVSFSEQREKARGGR
jgi:hypothetical protein